MHLSRTTLAFGGLALGACVAAVVLQGCGTKGGPSASGPMGDLTKQLMGQLHSGARQLNLSTDSVRRVIGDNGSIVGAYDGTRLLTAADTHAYGAPTIIDPAADIKGDGVATFNEVRHVVRHFDADANNLFDGGETTAFESAVGIKWLPAIPANWA